jgi:hypothetical protein
MDRYIDPYLVLIDNDHGRLSNGRDALISTRFIFEKIDFQRFPNYSKNLSQYLNLPISKYYCNPKNLSLALKGVFIQVKNIYLRVSIDISNSNKNKNCYRDEEIRKNLLPVFNFKYILLDSYID